MLEATSSPWNALLFWILSSSTLTLLDISVYWTIQILSPFWKPWALRKLWRVSSGKAAHAILQRMVSSLREVRRPKDIHSNGRLCMSRTCDNIAGSSGRKGEWTQPAVYFDHVWQVARHRRPCRREELKWIGIVCSCSLLFVLHIYFIHFVFVFCGMAEWHHAKDKKSGAQRRKV